MLEKITRIDQKVKTLCVLLSHECYLQKYTTYQFTYFIYYLFQDKFKNSKNYENPTSTPKVTYKTIFNILFKLFSICNSSKFKATHETRLI